MTEIRESGMTFVTPNSGDEIFHIERSRLYASVEGVKTVELVLRRDAKELDFIEAKSSAPRPDKANSHDFDDFIGDVAEKFIHSFNLFCAAALGRYKKCFDAGEGFRTLDYSDVKFKFILVVNGHKIDWLPPLREALRRGLLYHQKIWESELLVINDALARDGGLIK
jgi:hypothetical protein